MNIKNKILIQGKISDTDIENLIAEFENQNFEIAKYGALAHGEQDLLKLLFSDFSLISFTRDFVLSSLLTIFWSDLIKVFQSLQKRNKKVSNISIDINVKNSKGNTLFLKFSTTPDKFDLLIKQTDKTIDIELINSLDNNQNIYISLDDYNNIKIIKI